MLLWTVFALMAAIAVFAVLWPLSRHSLAGTEGTDLAVYRDQLDEIARDRAAGLIADAEAQAAKIEVSRRLLAAAEKVEQAEIPPAVLRGRSSLWRRRITAVAALLLVPVGATALYLALGSPQMPGEPLSARLNAIHQGAPITKLIAKVEEHLNRHPDDARGWEVVAPVYLRLGRFADAVRANEKAIEFGGETAPREADLGEALTAQAGGVVTAKAKSAFERATKLDAGEMKARFFLGVSAQQDGKIDEAADIWRGMLAKAPADAAWVPAVKQALASIGRPAPSSTTASSAPVKSESASSTAASAPGPSAAEVAAASKMSAQDRSAMIHQMVARLAERLKADGSDVQGWQRLLRAYMVLGERDKAKSAAADARKALASDHDKLRRIDDMIKSLGLQS
ncbi:MAG TPA: c-type cytochrome biogenesis protein CcmI [Pseudolabrys sp.]|nr:c-type cytochrome biogenesis protein CcmI [Pseudolabrys sp.]